MLTCVPGPVGTARLRPEGGALQGCAVRAALALPRALMGAGLAAVAVAALAAVAAFTPDLAAVLVGLGGGGLLTGQGALTHALGSEGGQVAAGALMISAVFTGAVAAGVLRMMGAVAPMT
jgi:hypothetical protein